MTASSTQNEMLFKKSIFPEHYCFACRIDCQSLKSQREHEGGRSCIKKHKELGLEPKFSTPQKKKVKQEIHIHVIPSLPELKPEPDYKLYEEYTKLDLIDGILNFKSHVIKITDLISDAYWNSQYSILPYVSDFETELANLKSALIILTHYNNYHHLEKSCLLIQRSWRHYRVPNG